ncbi:conserved hypothetical protein [Ricinus communis]|uniref:Uncharacterized protein n=1 Tax=Ricinus communis TaxID=3988 RepID=B9T5Y9_RICCO|nr:conserved hypothetical protein [Ricinus communis]
MEYKLHTMQSADLCEGHRQKQIELKHTITELEKELEQAKRKCAQLSAHLETRRKQKTLEASKEGKLISSS